MAENLFFISRKFYKFSVLLFLIFCLPSFAQKNLSRENFLISENAYRANNAGVGLLEQFKFDEAEKEFRRALKLKPDFSLAKINLAIALFNLKKLDETKQITREYLKTEKDSPQAFYILGLAARTENLSDEALENFKKVLSFDPNDTGANVNAGQLLAQKKDYAEAIKYFETAYKNEPAPSEIHFGLGKRGKADSIHLLWSSGIVQSEIDFANLQTAKNSGFLKIQEVDRKPASCPYLYTWNGEKIEFITDFLGGGEMANWAGKGEYHYPDSDEFVRIAPEKLKAKDGFYEIRVTNELEEVMYLDHLKLVAVEHDANAEIFPNEGLGKSENSNEKIYTSQNARAPISALNSDGENVTKKLEKLDNIFYADFKNLPIRGYAETHFLTLKLDDNKNFKGRTILFLTGWTDYAFSSDSVSASQSGKSLFMPYLQVKNEKGEWQTVIESIGIPVGRPQTLAVDLTGKFLTDSREVRIVTNFKTFWDKIAVNTSEQITDLKTFELKPETADLHERGYSAEEKIGGMIVPDYDKVSFDSRWKNFTGKFTRTGDIKFLLDEIDDIFVIAKAGDEFVLRFKELPKLPVNKAYTFLLYADGYSKEMDINSGSPDAVFPLPFKKMTKYPYNANEEFPMTDAKRKIYDETLTRFSRGGYAFK